MSYNFDMMSKITVTKEHPTDTVGASFGERSVWIQLISLLLVLAGYTFVAWQMYAAGVTALPPYAAVFTVAVVLMVAVLIAGLIAAALTTRRDDADERDRVIGWRAESHSGWVLAAGVVLGLAGMVMSVSNLWIAHLLLLSLFLSEILKLVLQLVFYRRGV